MKEEKEDASVDNSKKQQRLQHILILGSGFSGIEVLKNLSI